MEVNRILFKNNSLLGKLWADRIIELWERKKKTNYNQVSFNEKLSTYYYYKGYIINSITNCIYSIQRTVIRFTLLTKLIKLLNKIIIIIQTIILPRLQQQAL